MPSESFTLEGGRNEVDMTWLRRKARSWKNISVCRAMLTAMTRAEGLIPSVAHLSSSRSNISFTVSNNSYRVGIVGATGAVGQELIALLQAHAFPLAELRPLASARSAGKSIEFGGKKITVQEARPDAIAGLNVCFFAAGGSPALMIAAGVTTGIDLLLHRISDTCGPALAAQVRCHAGPSDPRIHPALLPLSRLPNFLLRVGPNAIQAAFDQILCRPPQPSRQPFQPLHPAGSHP